MSKKRKKDDPLLHDEVYQQNMRTLDEIEKKLKEHYTNKQAAKAVDDAKRKNMGFKRPDVIAVDFDGTLSGDAWPNVGKPNMKLINKLIELQKQGTKIILNTMREGKRLKEAVNFCKQHGLKFDAVNDNLPFLKMMYKNNPRKIYADIYIDDCNAGVNDDPIFTDLPFRG